MASNPAKETVTDNDKQTANAPKGASTPGARPTTPLDDKRTDTTGESLASKDSSGSTNVRFGDDTSDRRQALTELELARANNRRLTDLGILVMRIAALLVLTHGLSKLGGFGGFRNSVAQTSIGALAPDLVALLQITAEIALPIALFLGVLTRISGLLLAISMGTVWLLVHLLPNLSTPLTSSGGLQGEPALLFALIGLALFLTGGGRFSLDRMVMGKRLQARAERRAEKHA